MMKNPRIAIVLAAGVVVSLTATPAAAGLQEEVAAKEAELARLRAEVQPLVRPITVSGSDVRVFASLAPLVDAVASMNARPQDRRLITLQSTGRHGYFWRDGDTWCDSYVELDHGDSFKTRAVMSNFAAAVRDDGGIALGARAEAKGHVQLKFQFKGRRHRIYVLGREVGNVCPPGGGVGTSIGVGFDKTVDLQLLMAFSRSADGRSVDYKASFVSPREVSVTAQIGLGVIGTIGHPMSFDLPAGPIASGSFPLLVAQDGTFQLPGEAGERAYSFVLTPTAFAAGKSGITAGWKSTVQFKKPLLDASAQAGR